MSKNHSYDGEDSLQGILRAVPDDKNRTISFYRENPPDAPIYTVQNKYLWLELSTMLEMALIWRLVEVDQIRQLLKEPLWETFDKQI